MRRPGRGQLGAVELGRVVECHVLLHVRLFVCQFLFFLRRIGAVDSHAVVLGR
jgi:hypothetical protein